MSNERALAKYETWLRRRGRERSAPQYVAVVCGFLRNEAEYFNKINNKAYAANYRRHLVACLRSWAKFKKNKKLQEVLDDIRLPPAVPQGAREPLSLDEWIEVRDVIQKANWIQPFQRNALLIIVHRGIRVGDVLRVTLKHAREATKTGFLAFEAKGGTWKEFSTRAFQRPLQGLLEEWPTGAACVREGIALERGRSLAADDEKLQRAAKNAIAYTLSQVEDETGLELFAHRFRHTYATLFLQEMAGDPEALFKLQDQMGWAKLATAQNYLRRSRREELAEVEAGLLKKLNQ